MEILQRIWASTTGAAKRIQAFAPFFSSRPLSGRQLVKSVEKDAPLQLQLFNLEQLGAHAEALARKQRLSNSPGDNALLQRLSDNERALLDAYARISEALSAKQRISPAGEWILDNFHLIEEHIRIAKRHLPSGYSRELPQLAIGGARPAPRVYQLALEIIAHVDGRIDEQNVAHFISAYQKITPLTLGELWAIPIMLRLGLLENLRRVAARVVLGLEHRATARTWASRIRETCERQPRDLIIVAADMARAKPPLTNAFIAEFSQRIQDKGTLSDIPMAWIEQELAADGSSVHQRVQSEIQQQAANQVSVGASISSLRFINAADWRDFVESMSLVEAALKCDPAAVYARMDFATRDRYRHVVEALAREAQTNEVTVVDQALILATRSAAGKPEHHIGYYLVDDGHKELASHLKVSRLVVGAANARKLWALFYFSIVIAVTLAIPFTVIAQMQESPWKEAIIGILAGLWASQLGVALANWIVTLIKRPKILPRLDFSKAIPAECRTLVAVPTMLITPGQVAHLIESLEVRYLANRDDQLYFALLTDFTDATSEHVSGDQELLSAAELGIKRLNDTYASEGRDRFFLMHRPRVWVPGEGAWMGYERKRGKIEALNKMLRGAPATGTGNRPLFSSVVGDTTALRSVRYVITLDTDTQLPRDAAHKLVGTMSHPLNKACFDTKAERVTRGYGLLQPRVGVALPSSRRSWFVRLYAGDAGTDPYTHAVSDIYQDLFAEGSYIGKGIYDVDAFDAALGQALPDNLILSHDLIEGCYARSGLVSDVLLLEDHPSHFVEDLKRRRRWIRGDWQILYWLLPRSPRRDGTWRRNPLSGLSRWKIFDNLRRSVVAPAMLAYLVFGWFATRDEWLISRTGILLFFLLPFISAIGSFLRKPPYARLSAHLRFEARVLARSLVQAVLGMTLLVVDAVNAFDAAIRSATRMFVTKKHLLEWRSATDPRNAEGWKIWSFIRSMAASPLLAIILLTAFYWRGWSSSRAAWGFVAAWALAPFAARWLSAPLKERDARLSPDETRHLRELSRKTWAFFDDFVVASENHLPPDNYQIFPGPVVAHRTSPTNIGMAMLADLAALDFGYLAPTAMLRRVSQTLATMSRMDRFRGHFFNWYDTISLRPLTPRYISAVDSGNLCGHLLVLEAGLQMLDDSPIVPDRAWLGLQDTVLLAQAAAGRREAGAFDQLLQLLEKQPDSLGDCVTHAQAVRARIATLLTDTEQGGADAAYWLRALARQCDETICEPLAPFLDMTANESTDVRVLMAGSIPTLGTLASLATISSDERLARAAAEAIQTLADARAAAELCLQFATADYEFLYDRTRNLLSIGYNVDDHHRDLAHYDLLASEARLISFVGIAEGFFPQEHWFMLGRLMTSFGPDATLLSWSGSMFEYLMPLLVMPTFKGTILQHTYETVVRRQIDYARQNGVPWGISESGYNATDLQLNYQYKAFGVPGLGFKRGLAEDLVIAPYAAVMALMVAPKASTKNLADMRALGFEGRYGFFEAVDYTPSRLPAGQQKSIVQSHMAHHQGMSLLALAYKLLNQPMQRRFQSRASFQAAEPLLHERLPNVATFYPHAREVSEGPQIVREHGTTLRVISTPHTAQPEVQLLGNGRYNVLVTNSGGGYSRWNDLALTRWREDITTDDSGSFLYLRDVDDGRVWSSGYQPTRCESDRYEAIFPQSRAEFRRRDNDIDLHTEIAVSPEDDVEVRRYTLTNLSNETRTIEVTSFSEVVLAPQAADEAHPAFSNLFVQTELVRDKDAIICSRRPRSDKESPPLLVHLLSVHSHKVGETSFETDRRAFIGRSRTTSNALAMTNINAAALSGASGSVLDPIVAVRCQIQLAPEQSVSLHTVMGVAANHDDALALVDRYHDRHLADRVFELAWTHRQVVMRQLRLTEADTQLFMRLASFVLFSKGTHRAPAAVIAKNRRSQASLWAFGISGDLPIVLLRMSATANATIAESLIRAHSYWTDLGLATDLVIWNEDDSGYRQNLQDRLLSIVSAANASPLLDVKGGIFIRRIEQMGDDDRVLMQTVARAVFTDTSGTLDEQINAPSRPPPVIPRLPRRAIKGDDLVNEVADKPSMTLSSFNGLGGFSPDGREYVIRLSGQQNTPAPWVNVIANPYFGTVVSEGGGAYTWCENSHEYRVTPWSNDPVSDLRGEALYIRDDETGHLWSPSPFPIRNTGSYEVRHGFGYSVFHHVEGGIASELSVFVAIDAPVKLNTVRLCNQSTTPRTLTVSAYCEWVLGELRAKTAPHIVTEIDSTNGSICARNAYHPDFGSRIGFLDVSEVERGVTGDRTEFLGRNGAVGDPDGLRRERLSGRVGPGLDPCAAIQTSITLAPGEERTITFIMGVGRDQDDARTLIRRFGRTQLAIGALSEVRSHWDRVLGAVQVETPEPGIDLMINGWLTYQIISCRMWARTGFYQSGGAFGFRDQLQDAMALLHTHPRLLREQILRCAGRQFLQGDVQHWWHPHSGFGVRTHFSDDYLWLPLAVSRYVSGVGDTGILDVKAEFLEGRLVKPDEEGYGDTPKRSDESATVYEHCVRAIQYGLKFGERGLPLMGCGDWNDGMNLVGEHGRGESVWLAFFLSHVLSEFSSIARLYGDLPFAETCVREAERLKINIESTSWDGDWYRRAYFDDGTPLGSAANVECQIDSLPQSWAVLSGIGDQHRAKHAMESVDRRLVDRQNGVIKLFDPPFDKAVPNPGYIKGYVPGVRENGGQYTHAAIWTAMAFAKLGDAARAWELARMINPVGHGLSPADAAKYITEPYVVAADVYAVAPHIGRGGWTWYTGSAAWLYRLMVEALLGLTLAVDRLTFNPCVPADWPSYVVKYRFRNTAYRISFKRATPGNPKGTLRCDGNLEKDQDSLHLVDDLEPHVVEYYF